MMIKLKNLNFVFAILILFLFTIPTMAASRYKIDASHSEVGFKIKHLAISWVKGRFGDFSGSYVLPDSDLESASAEATIKMASVDTGVERRDDHLRNADFFDVEKFPEMTFKSKRVQSIEGNQFQLVGDLTMHGVTREVVLDVELLGKVKDPWGNQRSAFTASTVINRRDFGLNYSQLLETGGLVVGEEVHITLEIEGIEEK